MSAPSNIQATGFGANSMTLSWTAPTSSTPTSYTVTAQPGSLTSTLPGTATSATLPTTVSGVIYTVTVTANYTGSTASATATIISPLAVPVTTDVKPWLWYDAADLTTVRSNSSGVLTEWSNKGIGAVYTDANGTTYLNPTGTITGVLTVGETMGGRNGIKFSTAESVFTTPPMTPPAPACAQFIVIKLPSVATAAVSPIASSATGHITTTFSVSGATTGFVGDVVGNKLAYSSDIINDTNAHVFSFVNNSSSIDNNVATIDGVSQTLTTNNTTSSGALLTTASHNLKAGAGGILCEILVIRANITATQRVQIEGYLAWKWGLQANLPMTHPFSTANMSATMALYNRPRMYTSTFLSGFSIRDIACDSQSNIYVAMYTPSTGNSIIKYNSNGVTQWNYRLESSLGVVRMTIDKNDNLYVVHGVAYTILKFTPNRDIYFFKTGVDATNITTDSSGSVYYHDIPSGNIQKVTADGGNTTTFYEGSGVCGLACDANDNIYAASNFAIMKITPAGVATTFAGRAGVAGAADGVGTDATFNFDNNSNIKFDRAGYLYVAEYGGRKVRRISPAGVVVTLTGEAGVTTPTAAASNNLDILARYTGLTAVAPAPDGNIYIGDAEAQNVRKLSLGTRDQVGAYATFTRPYQPTADKYGNLYVGSYVSHSIKRISATGTLSDFVGSATAGSLDGVGTAATFNRPTGVIQDELGNMYIAEYDGQRIRKVSPAGYVTTLVTSIPTPVGLTMGPDGNIYVATYANHTIRQITRTGGVSIYAGISGSPGSTNNVDRLLAKFNYPGHVAFDKNGAMYVAEISGNYIRKIDSSGVTTFAGDGTTGGIHEPHSLAFDKSGETMYVAEYGGSKIRKITRDPVTQNAIITTVVATGLLNPTYCQIDDAQNLWVSDSLNNTVRHVAINASPTGFVRITGTFSTGNTIAADISNLVDSDGFGPFSYVWSRSATASGGFSTIAGATASTYVLTPDEADKFIRVTLSYTDGRGTVESVTSASEYVTRLTPLPPTLDSVTSLTTGATTIRWTAPSDVGSSPITAYQVEIDGGLAAQTSPTASSITIPLLYASYTFTVRAINIYGPSAPSTSIPHTVYSPPDKPTLVSAIPTGNTVALVWQEPSNTGGVPITGYTIYRDGIVYDTATATDRTYTATNLLYVTTYTWRVSASNTHNGDIRESNLSDPKPATTGKAAPTTPTIVAADPVDNNTNLDVSWTASDPRGSALTSYAVLAQQIRPDRSFTFEAVQLDPVNSYTISLTIQNKLGFFSGLTVLVYQSSNSYNYFTATVDTYVASSGQLNLRAPIRISPSFDASAPHIYYVDYIDTFYKSNSSVASIVLDPASPSLQLTLSFQTPYVTGERVYVYNQTAPANSFEAAVSAYDDSTGMSILTLTGITNVRGTFTNSAIYDIQSYTPYVNRRVTIDTILDPISNVDLIFEHTPSSGTYPAGESVLVTQNGDASRSFRGTIRGTILGTDGISRLQIGNIRDKSASFDSIQPHRYDVYVLPREIGVTVNAPTTTAKLPGVEFGTTYMVRVTANSTDMGSSAPSVPAYAIIASLPGVPTDLVVEAMPPAIVGDPMNVKLTWANAQSNGSDITSYTISISPATITSPRTFDSQLISISPTQSSVLLTGLSNTTQYTFTVYATSGVGNGPSVTSLLFTFPTLPDPPTPKTIESVLDAITLTWDPPINTGGDRIRNYIITPVPDLTPSAVTTVDGAQTSLTLRGFPLRTTTYAFTIQTVNAAGTSVASAPPLSIMPTDVPQTPTGVTLTTSGVTFLRISWTPADDGGSPLTGYSIQSDRDGFTFTAPSSATQLDVSDADGLQFGVSYSFTMIAQNKNGPSVRSNPTSTGFISTVPGAPTIVGTPTSGHLEASVTWTPPSFDGFTPITGYRISASPDNHTRVISDPLARTGTLTGLTNGTAYTLSVNAINAAGESAPATATATVVPNYVATGLVIIGMTQEGQQLTADIDAIVDLDGKPATTNSSAYSYKWESGSANQFQVESGRTSRYITLTDADVGRYFRVTVTFTDLIGITESVTSPVTTVVENVNSLATGTLTIPNNATLGDVLTITGLNTIQDADGAGVDPALLLFTYQWQVSADGISAWTDIANAITPTFTIVRTVAKQYVRTRVQFYDARGTLETLYTNRTNQITNQNANPTGTVSIVGQLIQGTQLTILQDIQDADGLGTFQYQWFHWTEQTQTPIVGATQTIYTLQQSDVGKFLRVVISYTDRLDAFEQMASAPRGPIINVNDPLTGTLTVNVQGGGPVEETATLVAVDNIADADGLGVFTYTWLFGLTPSDVPRPIPGAPNAPTYTLQQRDVNTFVCVRVSYTDLQGTAESITSSYTTQVRNVNQPVTGTVTITGQPLKNTLLSIENTLQDTDGLGQFQYQWYRDNPNTPIVGATERTYVPRNADIQKYLYVKIYFTDAFGTYEEKISDRFGPIQNVNTPPQGDVLLRGEPIQHSLLEAIIGFVDADNQTGYVPAYTYTWQQSPNLDDVSFAPITGVPSTSPEYTLTQAQVNHYVRVVVSYMDGGGVYETVTSNVIGPIENANDLPTGTVVIDGIIVQGEVLTALNTIVDEDGLGAFTYTWLYSGDEQGTYTTIVGSTDSATYRLAQSEVGKYIKVRITYTDAFGTPELVESISYGPVADLNNPPQGSVTILVREPDFTLAPNQQTLSEFQIVEAVSNFTDADDGVNVNTITYTWKYSPTEFGQYTEIPNSNQERIQLSEQVVDAFVAVTVTYKDNAGFTNAITSRPLGPVLNVNTAPVGGATVVGTLRQYETIGITQTIIDVDQLGQPINFSYEWQSTFDVNSVSPDTIASGGPTTNTNTITYTLTQAEVGKYIRIYLYYTDRHGSTEHVYSPYTATTVANVNDAPTGTLTIQGTLIQNDPLTVDTSGIVDIDGIAPDSQSFVWYIATAQNGTYVPIAGQTSSVFIPRQDHVRQWIKVRMSYTDAYGAQEQTQFSAAVGPIVDVNDVPTGAVTVSGRITESETLTVSNTLVDPDTLLPPITYTWKRSTSYNGPFVPIAGVGNSTTYVLKPEDVNNYLVVTASYKDFAGFDNAVDSTPVGPIRRLDRALPFSRIQVCAGPSGVYMTFRTTQTAPGQSFVGKLGNLCAVRCTVDNYKPDKTAFDYMTSVNR